MIKWITLAPMIGALINGLFGKRFSERLIGLIACGSVAVSAVLSFYVFLTQLLPLPPESRRVTEHFFTWLAVGNFRADFAYLLDPLSASTFFITGVGLLIHITPPATCTATPATTGFCVSQSVHV
jgi:NADH-quinone oxidoreductase subunit L